MTFAADTLPYTQSFFWAETPRGVSADAGVLESLTQGAFKSLSDYKERFFVSKVSSLLEDFITNEEDNETSTDNAAISPSALSEVSKALQSLPRDIPLPSLIKEASGAVALEWYKNPKNVFVASFNGTKTIEYAAIYGLRSELHGKVEFQSKIPNHLLTQIKIFQV